MDRLASLEEQLEKSMAEKVSEEWRASCLLITRGGSYVVEQDAAALGRDMVSGVCSGAEPSPHSLSPSPAASSLLWLVALKSVVKRAGST
jgi:hypothetical protein